VVAGESHREKMLGVLRQYQKAKKGNLLLMIPFVTITDYLHELRAIARLMRPLGTSGLLYLAAAVSDFFVPPDRMAEHKIQSTDIADKVKRSARSAASSPVPRSSATTPSSEPAVTRAVPLDEEETFDNFDSSPKVPRSKRLVIDLDPVPKFLKNLVDGWAPEGMIVSFKLETDPSILVHKAAYSLERYQHHLVIGNLLATRKWEVVFVAPGRQDRWIRLPRKRSKSVADAGRADGAVEESDEPMDPSAMPEEEPDVEIESLIVPAVEDMHTQHIKAAPAKRK
jgi:phosphopantothenate-cysteine ligase